MDAKVICVIDDLTRSEIIAVLADSDRVFSHTERTVTLREYIRGEYIAGRIESEVILAAYDGGLS